MLSREKHFYLKVVGNELNVELCYSGTRYWGGETPI